MTRERRPAPGLALEERLEGLQERPRPLGHPGPGFAALTLPDQRPHRLPDALAISGERRLHAAVRERQDQRAVGRGEMLEQALDAVPEEGLPPRDEGQLVDEDDEAAPDRHPLVRGVRSRKPAGLAVAVPGDAVTRRSPRIFRARPFSRISISPGCRSADRCAIGEDGAEVHGEARRLAGLRVARIRDSGFRASRDPGDRGQRGQNETTGGGHARLLLVNVTFLSCLAPAALRLHPLPVVWTAGSVSTAHAACCPLPAARCLLPSSPLPAATS